VETFTCPHCGGKTDYNPDEAGRAMRVEEQDGKPSWCVYARVRCAHCGREAEVLRSRSPLP
jgi:DNA-directed RNA polymerase subunit RPC12/RpoP